MSGRRKFNRWEASIAVTSSSSSLNDIRYWCVGTDILAELNLNSSIRKTFENKIFLSVIHCYVMNNNYASCFVMLEVLCRYICLTLFYSISFIHNALILSKVFIAISDNRNNVSQILNPNLINSINLFTSRIPKVCLSYWKNKITGRRTNWNGKSWLIWADPHFVAIHSFILLMLPNHKRINKFRST